MFVVAVDVLTENHIHRNDCPRARGGRRGEGGGGDEADTGQNPSKNTSNHFVSKSVDQTVAQDYLRSLHKMSISWYVATDNNFFSKDFDPGFLPYITCNYVEKLKSGIQTITS